MKPIGGSSYPNDKSSGNTISTLACTDLLIIEHTALALMKERNSTHLDNGELSTMPAPMVDLPKRDYRFWLSFLAICISVFIAALELVRQFQSPYLSFLLTSLQTAVATALPTIVNDLEGSEFVWAGSAYALASTAFIPFNGGLAQVIRLYYVLYIDLVLFHSGRFTVAS
jgi:hypothetical protein